MARMTSSDNRFWLWNCARILKDSYLTEVISTCQKFHHILAMRFVGSINSVNIGSIGLGFKNPLDWPSQCNVPTWPLFVSCFGGSWSLLFSSFTVPEKKLVWSTCWVNGVGVSWEIEMLDITVVLDFCVFFLNFSTIPCVNIYKSKVVANS